VKATILNGGEDDLEQAFDYYESLRARLGTEFLDEFRRALERVISFPNAWQLLDPVYRRCRLHRFPYGIVYRVDSAAGEIVVVAVMHLSRAPGSWRNRDR
jgi:plasmid stabilization system protein ParE